MSEIRELLEKWAELEPSRCRRETVGGFERLLVLSPLGWQLVMDEEEPGGYYSSRPLTEAIVQYVVQQAIIARGWSFALNYNPDCPDPANPYDARVDGPTSEGWGFGGENIVTPLLSAYLETLEAQR
jgi:hypothetical protein